MIAPGASGFGAGPPSISEFRAAHSALKSQSVAVQGEIQVFRIESIKPEALRGNPEDLGVPLTLRGQLWRNSDAMRVDFTSFNAPGAPRQQSVALDEEFVYSLTQGSTPDGGMLRVCSRESSEGAALHGYIDLTFMAPIDALWRHNDRVFADLLQRPDMRLEQVVSDSLDRELISLVGNADGTDATLRFEAGPDYPFVDAVSEASAEEISIKVERYVESIDLGSHRIPTRIADIAYFGPASGYTQVVLLTLEPLAAESPLARDLTASSFRDLGFGYQVYYVTEESPEGLGERYQPPVDLSSRPQQPPSRKYFLWANGALLVLVCVVLGIRYVMRRSSRP